MSANPFSAIPVNPFSNRWITDPRQPDTLVESLNGKILDQLEAVFETVPGSVAPIPVQLVVSPSAGFGKSHLIGRFFRRLGKKATRVYIRPFIDPKNSWRYLLSQVVHELTQPDNAGEHVAKPGTISQLDALAQGVLSSLLDSAAANHLIDVEKTRRFLETEVLGKAASEKTWANPKYQSLEAALLTVLQSQGVETWTGSPKSYLRVFLSYTADRQNAARRQLCLEWLRGKPLESDETACLGIAAGDVVPPDASGTAINQSSKERVIELCQFSKLFRPFVFCFDQTEVFAKSAELSYEFGSLFSEIFQEAPNQLTVITANKDVWDRVHEKFDNAHRQRIAPILELQGIDREQGRELAEQRLEPFGLSGPAVASFISQDWLDDVFSTGNTSVRDFLTDCERRFNELKGAGPITVATLDELVDELRQDRLLNKNRLFFDGDIVQWAIAEIAKTPPGGRTIQSSQSHRFPVVWFDPKTRVKTMFGFEDGDHHATWAAVAKEAEKLVGQNVPGSRCISLRSDDLTVIPPATWKVAKATIQQAIASNHLVIHSISIEMLAKILAARDLYVQACQKDIPYTPEEVITFLNEYLKEWWESLAGNSAGPITPPPTPGVVSVSDIEKIVSSGRFVTALQIKAGIESQRAGFTVTHDQILQVAGQSPNITCFTHPNNAVFQWKKSGK